MTRYDYFYREKFTPDQAWKLLPCWDVFISAYNFDARVQSLFKNVKAKEKYWLGHAQYGIRPQTEIAKTSYFTSEASDEAGFIHEFFDWLKEKGHDVSSKSICIDITGFMRPELMFLIRKLGHMQVNQFDILYAEPLQYAMRELTKFSKGIVKEVRQVAGFEGLHTESLSKSLLVIGAGYEHHLIKHVAEAKENASKLQIFGFPPLQPDFYQENILGATLASEAVGRYATDPRLAPANDPFATAAVLSEIISKHKERYAEANVYLAPLATKPQALGFALYYIFECIDRPVSIIYPFCSEYEPDTSVGIGKIWRYHIELL